MFENIIKLTLNWKKRIRSRTNLIIIFEKKWNWTRVVDVFHGGFNLGVPNLFTSHTILSNLITIIVNFYLSFYTEYYFYNLPRKFF